VTSVLGTQHNFRSLSYITEVQAPILPHRQLTSPVTEATRFKRSRQIRRSPVSFSVLGTPHNFRSLSYITDVQAPILPHRQLTSPVTEATRFKRSRQIRRSPSLSVF